MYYEEQKDGTYKKIDVMEWAKKYSKEGARVIQQDKVGPFFISTVYLGLDHRFLQGGPPLIYETMIFHDDSGFMEHYQQRYSRSVVASETHQRIVKVMKDHFEGRIDEGETQLLLESSGTLEAP